MRLLQSVVISIRPHQWIKNTLVFAALFFSHEISLFLVLKACAAFACFCAVSGAVYLLNDFHDRNEDREHTLKSDRPIARGELNLPWIIVTAFFLAAGALAGAFGLGRDFGVVVLSYFALMVCYTYYLRSIVIVDILTVMIGFVLRAVAGVCLIGVEMSAWLIVCTGSLALLVVLGKRFHDVKHLGDNLQHSRKVLLQYDSLFLNQLIAIAATSTVVSYALYTLSDETVLKHHTRLLIYTAPFVLFGIFRYLYLIYLKDGGGKPERLFMQDVQLLGSVIAWIVALYLLIYRH